MKNADMPASPIIGDWENFKEFIDQIKGGCNYGLTKRETFAMHAMQGLCANSIPGSHSTPKNLTREAIECADTLLAALEDNQQ